jgi:ADP-heptose:LPS heptosyltransferase
LKMNKPVRILIRCLGGFGLGDTVQYSVVFKHLAKYRPDWIIDVRAPRDAHVALVGLCSRVMHHDEPELPPDNYDQTADLHIWENYIRFSDRPSNKVTYCLKQTFNLDYDHSLGRYEVHVPVEAKQKAWRFLRTINADQNEQHKFKAVILHYEGSSNKNRKNLAHWQAEEICQVIRDMGRVPIIFDWDARSSLPDQKTVFCPGRAASDASVIAGMIGSVEAFIGVDSGPGKIASATDTNSLICWTNHHPLQYHDPAPFTTHLIRKDWAQMPPIEGDEKMAAYFEDHYAFQTYAGEHGMVGGVAKWLAHVLEHKEWADPGIHFVVPSDPKGLAWVLLKVRNIAQGRPIHFVLSSKTEYAKAMAFLKRFCFLASVRVADVPLLISHAEPVNTRGHHRFISDGRRDGYFYLMPGTIFEPGGKLEDWASEAEIDTHVVEEFEIDGCAEEYVAALLRELIARSAYAES